MLDDDGKPTTAGLTIRDRQGRVYPSPAKRLAPDFSFHPQVYRADGESLLLPDGEFTFTYSGGPEYRLARQTVRVTPDGPSEMAMSATALSGTEIAATYTIHVSVRTTVQPGASPSGSRLESRVQAYARNNDGANALASQCHSKGLLEGLIALRVLEKLGASTSTRR